MQEHAEPAGDRGGRGERDRLAPGGPGCEPGGLASGQSHGTGTTCDNPPILTRRVQVVTSAGCGRMTGACGMRNEPGTRPATPRFQFKSTQAVAQYVAMGKPVKVLDGLALQYDDRQIPVSPLPGALVTTEYIGSDTPSDECEISIRAPIGNYVLIVSISGGTDLDWNNVLPYWTKISSLLGPLESRR